MRTIGGETRAIPLTDGLTVADFDARLHAALAGLGIDVAIREEPYGVPMKTPFRKDTEHASWDREAIERFHDALDWAASMLEEFSGWFAGKQSPVQLFWHSFDLSLTRFSGRPGLEITSDAVNREAYTHEVMLFGFWMGEEQTFPDASFFAFMNPAPEGLRDAAIVGGEQTPIGLVVLPWETVRNARDPRALVFAFLQSAYEVAAGLAGWDIAALESAWCPAAEQLEELRTSAGPSGDGAFPQQRVARRGPLRGASVTHEIALARESILGSDFVSELRERCLAPTRDRP